MVNFNLLDFYVNFYCENSTNIFLYQSIKCNYYSRSYFQMNFLFDIKDISYSPDTNKSLHFKYNLNNCKLVLFCFYLIRFNLILL